MVAAGQSTEGRVGAGQSLQRPVPRSFFRKGTPVGGLFDVTSAALEVALRVASRVRAVLANNLANVNTPNFKRSDVSFQGRSRRRSARSSDTEVVAGIAPRTATERTRCAPTATTSTSTARARTWPRTRSSSTA